MSLSPVLPEGTPEKLADLVLNLPKWLLMTDYDGTLTPIREKPELALPDKGLLELLQLVGEKNRVTFAVISGRDAGELQNILPVAGIYLAGCHGAEFIYPCGQRYSLWQGAELGWVFDVIAGEAERIIKGASQVKSIPFKGGDAAYKRGSASARKRTESEPQEVGFLIERKKTAVALHYRLAKPVLARSVSQEFVKAVQPLAGKYNLEIIAGKKVLEVRPRGINKGEAVRHLMRLYPGHYPIYLGDDRTDEDAFVALKKKGVGVLVAGAGVVVAGGVKNTAASHRLPGPDDVVRFLQIMAMRC